jgi:ABC-2 type transport system permease protein
MSAVEVVPPSPQKALVRQEARRLSTRFLRSELKIIFGRRRNQAGLAVLGVVPIILAIAVKASIGRGRGGGPDFFASITGNGLFVALAALTVELPLFLPLAVSAISGDSIAGEANLGTLRYLLTVPIGRTRLLAIKFLAITIFAFVAALVVALVGAVIGLILFGGGNLTLLSGSQIGFGAALLRLLLTTAYLAVGLAALGAIGLFVSTLTEQPIAAMIAVVILNVTMFILDSLPQLDWLHPWLLTHWWTSFGDFYRDPMAWSDPVRGLSTAAGYALVFWLAAWARLGNKDITS